MSGHIAEAWTVRTDANHLPELLVIPTGIDDSRNVRPGLRSTQAVILLQSRGERSTLVRMLQILYSSRSNVSVPYRIAVVLDFRFLANDAFAVRYPQNTMTFENSVRQAYSVPTFEAVMWADHGFDKAEPIQITLSNDVVPIRHEFPTQTHVRTCCHRPTRTTHVDSSALPHYSQHIIPEDLFFLLQPPSAFSEATGY